MASIIIPSSDDRITFDDIKKNQLRITNQFMNHFPYEDVELKLIINNKEFKGSLDLNNKDGKQRSYRLVLRKEGMAELNLQEGECVEITKIDTHTYELSRVAIEEQTRLAQRAFLLKFAPK